MFTFSYSFEGSSETRQISNHADTMKSDDFCQLVLKEFGEKSCEISIDVSEVHATTPVVIKRTYGKKFEHAVKPKIPPPPRTPPTRRRWRSRSPVSERHRRFKRGRRHGNRYNRVYSNANNY